MRRVVLAWLGCLFMSVAGAAQDIQFWHAMAGARGAALDALVARFNAAQTEVRVVARYTGPYDETQREALRAHGQGRGPHVVHIYEVGTADMIAARDAVRPLWRVMVEAGKPLQHGAFLPAVVSYFSDANGRLLALPFNVSTPVLYYNKDAFRRAGLDPEVPPKTWYEMPAVLGALIDAKQPCGLTTTWPSWVLLENMSAWHNQPFATQHNGLDGLDARLSFNTRLMVRWVSVLSSWNKAGYYSYSGREDAAELRFAQGSCGMLAASSSSIADLKRRAQFEIGVAQLPYYDDYPEAPQNTLIGGAGLWVMADKSRREYNAIARWMQYLAQPEVQSEWHEATGYVPITRAAYALSRERGFYATHPGHEVAIRQLLLRNPTRETKGIRLGRFLELRAIIEDELEAVWSERKTPMDALSAAVQRGNEVLEGFEAANTPARGQLRKAPRKR